MFFSTRTHRDSRSPRRAFRPGADQLESREVLSTLSLPGASKSVVIPGVTGHSLTNFATSPAAFLSNITARANTAANTAHRVSVTAPTNPLPTVIGGSISSGGGRTFTSSSTRGNSLHEAGQSTSLPREAGGTVGLPLTTTVPLSGSLLGTGVTTTAPLSSTSAANGLAFTNGLGFSNLPTTTNAALNGLAFTNGLGGSLPGSLSPFLNATNSGLAFTNGLGGSLPGSLSPFLNSATTGLTFTNGLGFSNQSQNPFFNFAANSIPTTFTPTFPITGGMTTAVGTGVSSLLINGANGVSIL